MLCDGQRAISTSIHQLRYCAKGCRRIISINQESNRMTGMRYERPTTLKAAAQMLGKQKGQAFILAGGTDLLVHLRTGFIEPDLIVDIKSINGSKTIQKTATGFKIGSAVSGAELGEHAALKKAWPGVVE